jgi:hypothetical protein
MAALLIHTNQVHIFVHCHFNSHSTNFLTSKPISFEQSHPVPLSTTIPHNFQAFPMFATLLAQLILLDLNIIMRPEKEYKLQSFLLRSYL